MAVRWQSLITAAVGKLARTWEWARFYVACVLTFLWVSLAAEKSVTPKIGIVAPLIDGRERSQGNFCFPTNPSTKCSELHSKL